MAVHMMVKAFLLITVESEDSRKDKMIVLVLALLSLWSTRVVGFYVQPEVPVFSAHPRSQLVPGNASITLTCSLPLQNTSANLPRPQVYWLLNGTNISEVLHGRWTSLTSNDSSHMTSELNVSSLSLSHAGYYQCLAKDGMTDGRLCGSSTPVPCVSSDVLSDRAWIQVIAYDVHQLEERHASVPGSALLECGSEIVQAIRKNVAVVWKKNDSTITNSSQVFPLESGDLMVYVSEDVLDYFNCYITDDVGNVHYRTYRVITMNQPEADQPLPEVSIFSTRSAVLQGGSLQLACSVVIGNSSSADISWIRFVNSSEELIDRRMLQFHNSVLSIDGVTRDSRGTYCCEVGGMRSCTDITVITEVLLWNPLQLFIDFRLNMTHCVNITCPIPQNITPVHWFWNGIELENDTDHDLERCSNDPYQLYGIYQCLAGLRGEYEQVLERDVGVVARVLPYGITNPAGRWTVMELPQPSPIWPGESYFPILITWTPPFYFGNLLTVTYQVVNLYDGRIWNSSNEYIQINVLKFTIVSLNIFVYHELFDIVSSELLVYEDLQPSCSELVFYPPQIVNASCSSGSVQVHFMINRDNEGLTFNPNAPVEFYFKGNCTNNQTSYTVLYEMDDSSPFLVGGGMAFQAGTTCTLAAANTPSHALLLLDRYADKTACYDLEYLAYSDYHSCIVHASVGFVSAQQVVQVSSECFEVCVQSRGYGFTVYLSTNSSNYIDYEEMILDFNSPDNTSVQCVNISIYDSGVSGSTEVVALSITTENSFVILDDTLSLITVENDVAVVMFLSDAVAVLESVGSVNVCVLIEGTLLSRNVTVSIHGSGPHIGNFSIGMVTFSPEGQSSQCLPVSIRDDDVVHGNRNLTITLSSTNPAVKTDQNPVFVVEILEDDYESIGVSQADSTTYEPPFINPISRSRLLVGILTIFLICVCGLVIIGGCIATIKIYRKRIRDKYLKFQKELVNTFDSGNVMDENDYKYLIVLESFEPHTENMDDDNISQIEPLEPNFMRNSETTSPVMSVTWGSLDDSEHFNDSSRCSDYSGGYINHLDRDDDKIALLPSSEQESNDLPFQTRVQVESLPVTNNTSASTGGTHPLLYRDAAQDCSTSNESNGGSLTEDTAQIMQSNTLLNSGHSTKLSIRRKVGSELLNNIESPKGCIHSDHIGNDDSGYPQSSQDTDQEEQIPYNDVSMSQNIFQIALS